MDRRQLLHSTSLTMGAALLASACGSDDGDGAAPGTVGSATPPPGDAEQTLFVQGASLEFLVGADRWMAFGVTTQDNSPLPEGAEVEVFLRRVATTPDQAGEVIAGPLPASYSPATETGQGVYYLRTDLEEAGFVEIVAVSGDDVGVAAVQIVDPEDSQVKNPVDDSPVIPGSMAISAPTPTVADDRGVFDICTQDPQCGMHEMSLDEALASGRPVAVMFATPQFCQTAVCGPSVATLNSLREGGDWGDTVFVHSEIFAEDPTGADVGGAVLVDAVQAWGLPTEPWFFTVGGDGVIVGRVDGPMPEPILRGLLEGLA